MISDYQRALDDLHTAENHFSCAAPEYIDTAIMELEAAKRRLVAIIEREKANAGRVV